MDQPDPILTFANLDRLGNVPGYVHAYPNVKVAPYVYDPKTGLSTFAMKASEYLKHSEGIARLAHQSRSRWRLLRIEVPIEANERETKLMAEIESLQRQLAETRGEALPERKPEEDAAPADTEFPELEAITREYLEAPERTFRGMRSLAIHLGVKSSIYGQTTKKAAMVEVILSQAETLRSELTAA